MNFWRMFWLASTHPTRIGRGVKVLLLALIVYVALSLLLGRLP